MEYDDLLKLHVGEFGRYQKLVILIVAITCIPGAINSLNIVFLAAVPKHFCHSPSTAHLNLSRKELLTLTTPPSDRFCNYYGRQYTNWTPSEVEDALNSTSQANVSEIPCKDGWNYDSSTYKSTIVTQWNLVCDKKALVPTAASVFMAGLTLGVLVCGYLADRYGRKIVCLICSILMAAFAIAIPFSPNYTTFVILRFFLGMPTFGLITTALVLGVEMVGPSWRVFAGTAIWFCWPLGYIIVAGVAYGLREWDNLALALGIPQAAILIAIFILPESPRWLYSKNKPQQAETIVRRMARINHKELPENIMVEVTKTPDANFWELFRHTKLRQRTLILFFIWFSNSVVYYGLALNTSNLGGNDYINFFIAGAVEFPALIFYQISSEHLGRRKTVAGTMIVAGLSLICIAAVPSDFESVITALAMGGKFCITVSFDLIYIYSAEIFPTVVRSVGVAGGSFWARVGSIIAPYIGSLVDINKLIPFIILGCLSIASGLLALVLPETKRQQLPESIEDGENFPPQHTSIDATSEVFSKPAKVTRC